MYQKNTIPNISIAVGMMALHASSASAAIIYLPGQEIPIPTTFEGVSVNLETGAVTNALAGAPGADVNFVLGGRGITNDADETASAPTFQPVRSGTGNTDPIVELTFGTVVGPTSVTGNDFGGSSTHFATFTSGTQGYIGFEVVLADTTVSYGWLLTTLQDDNTPGVIHSWAYENSGAAITVGAIPEPSHSLLSIFGLAALALRRRR
ncbi:MAG: hypothetical protein ACI9NC_004920 [Verrucomicrobiales bacterium]|jgi:hypothetical protein